jgi:hypothetical protein
VLAVGTDVVFGFSKVLEREPGVIEAIALLIAVYVGGSLIATPSKAVLEDGLVEDPRETEREPRASSS